MIGGRSGLYDVREELEILFARRTKLVRPRKVEVARVEHPAGRQARAKHVEFSREAADQAFLAAWRIVNAH